MNFEEISKKVMKISKDTMTEVQKMNEVRQLNSKINEERKLLNRLYLELGQKLYDIYKDAETPLEEFADDFQRIEERYSTIDLLQDQVRAVKGVVLCPCCNMEVSVTERYCSNCGSKMPAVIEIEDTVEDDNAVVVESEVIETDAEPADDGMPAGEAAEAAEPEAEAATGKEKKEAEAAE